MDMLYDELAEVKELLGTPLASEEHIGAALDLIGLRSESRGLRKQRRKMMRDEGRRHRRDKRRELKPARQTLKTDRKTATEMRRKAFGALRAQRRAGKSGKELDAARKAARQALWTETKAGAKRFVGTVKGKAAEGRAYLRGRSAGAGQAQDYMDQYQEAKRAAAAEAQAKLKMDRKLRKGLDRQVRDGDVPELVQFPLEDYDDEEMGDELVFSDEE
jgi:hypothetical protein